MKDLKDQFIGMNINQKYKQKQLKTLMLQDFLLMLLSRELIDYLPLLLITLMMMPMK